MRVFVTGGTGFVGSAVVADLLAAGHAVLGLARSDGSAARLRAAGAEAHAGSLEDLDALRAATSGVDAVIHTAFDNSNLLHFPRQSRIERAALHAVGGLLANTGRPLIAAAGFAPVTRVGPLYSEEDGVSDTAGPVGRNVERTVMRLADSGVNASVVRMPVVHGAGDQFTLHRFIEFARKSGESAYVGDGSNRWPAVHRSDAARVFRLAMERGITASRYHAVAEEGVPYRHIADAIGRRLHLPVISITPFQARRRFGLYAPYAQNDGPATSALTRAGLDWNPTGPTLLTDIHRSDNPT